MSYSGTVRCSYCGTQGHNRAGCTDYKDRIEELRLLEGSSHVTVQQYDYALKRKAEAAKNRKCTYCGQPEHNRRSCSVLKEVIESFRAKNATFCKNMLAAFIEKGLGPGAIISVDNYGERIDYLVTGIKWTEANMHTRTPPMFKCLGIRSMGTSWPQHRYISAPKSVSGAKYGNSFEILVHSNESRIRASGIPAAFLDGSVGIKALFSDKGSTMYTMKDYYGSYRDAFDIDVYSTDYGPKGDG
jgi:hypothetical protein